MGRAGLGDRRSRGGGTGRVGRRPRGRGRTRATHRARLRAERVGRRRDRGAGRGTVRVAERPRPDPRGRRPGAHPAHDRTGRSPGRATGTARRRTHHPDRVAPGPPRAWVQPRPGSGRQGRVRAARRDRRRLPAVGVTPRSDRAVRRRDRLPAGIRSNGPADGRGHRCDRSTAGLRVPAARRRGRHAP